MPAVDVLMGDGTWVRNQSSEQAIINLILQGSDLYTPSGVKLKLVSFAGGWSIADQGGSGPLNSITLAEYLGKSSSTPSPTTTTATMGNTTENTSGCSVGICGVTPTVTRNPNASGSVTGTPTTGVAVTGGSSASPTSGGFGGGVSSPNTGSVQTSNTPNQMGTEFDWQAFFKGPFGIGLLILAGLIVLVQIGKRG